jgi:hypothetical protein
MVSCCIFIVIYVSANVDYFNTNKKLLPILLSYDINRIGDGGSNYYRIVICTLCHFNIFKEPLRSNDRRVTFTQTGGANS